MDCRSPSNAGERKFCMNPTSVFSCGVTAPLHQPGKLLQSAPAFWTKLIRLPGAGFPRAFHSWFLLFNEHDEEWALSNCPPELISEDAATSEAEADLGELNVWADVTDIDPTVRHLWGTCGSLRETHIQHICGGCTELWRVLERLKCHTRGPSRLRRGSRCRCT